MTAPAAALDLLASLVLDNGQRWGDIATDWQWSFVQTVLDPDAPMGRWESRPRGASKTTDTAAVAVVALAAMLPAGAECHAFARDLDQARRIRDFANGFVQRTPGLASRITLDRYVIRSRSGSMLTIESADAASAYGQLSSLTIVDELCQWPETENSKTLWEAITTGMGKVPGAKLVVITTSGDPGSWSHGIYKHARWSKLWTVQDVPGPLPWVEPEFIEDQRQDLPPAAFGRMHLNQWIEGSDRLTTEADLLACVTLSGPLPWVEGHRYVVTADLGFVKDRSVVAVMHTELERGLEGEVVGHRVVLDQLRVWAGTRRHPVNADDVEAQIVEWCQIYRASALVDPHEAVGMIQRVRGRGFSIEQYNFTTTSVGNLGLGLFQAIKSHRLAIWHDEDLLDELLHVKLVEKTVGSWRLDHSASRHDDRAVALAMGIVFLATAPGSGAPLVHSDEEWAAIQLAARRSMGEPIPEPAPEWAWYSGDTSMRASVPQLEWTDDVDDEDPDERPNGRTARSPFV